MELNFLFGNPVKGKKGGKGMAAKKRSAAKAKPKRRRSAKKNPVVAGRDTAKKQRSKYSKLIKPEQIYLKPGEARVLERLLKNQIKNLGRPPIRFTKEEQEAAAAAGVNLSKYSGAPDLIEPYRKTKAALEKARKGATGNEANRITRKIRDIEDEIAKLSFERKGQSSKERKEKLQFILTNLNKLNVANAASDGWKTGDLSYDKDWDESELLANVDTLYKSLKTKGVTVSKTDLTKAILEAQDKGKEDELIDALTIMNNPRRKKGMAKKRRKSKGAKVAYKKRRKKGAKVAHKKRRKKSKSAKIAAAIAAAQAGHKKRSKKRRGHKRSHKRRNPISGGMMMDLAMIAGAGAFASLAVGAVNKYGVKPLLTKFAPTVASNKAVQLAVGVAVPAALYMVMKKLAPIAKMSFLDKAADVLAVVTAANIGGRMITSVLPGGMIAGIEPALMGVEPQLMGNADFGDADFGDADFGAVEQFSGVEPQLMGSADFGAVEQFSGYDAASLGAVQMYGDEDYAGEDLDGDSDFGLG